MQTAKEITMYPVTDTIKENQLAGFICIYRSVKKHWIWKQNRIKTTFEAWVDLLLRASHDDQKEPVGIDFITVNKGQVLTSQLQLSKDWYWSRKKVVHFLGVLQKDKMLDVQTSAKWSMITICNYASYQSIRTTKEQQKNIRGTSEEHIQPLKPLKPLESTPQKNFLLHTPTAFFKKELADHEGEPELVKYKNLVEYLQAKDERGQLNFINILSLNQQISYADYLKLKVVEAGSSRTLQEVLEAMENTAGLKKKYKSVFLTAKNWLQTEFKK